MYIPTNSEVYRAAISMEHVDGRILGFAGSVVLSFTFLRIWFRSLGSSTRDLVMARNGRTRDLHGGSLKFGGHVSGSQRMSRQPMPNTRPIVT